MMKIDRELQPWFWCLGWLCAFMGLTILLVQQFYLVAATPDCKREYSLLLSQPPSHHGSSLVVALGDSLLKHATPKRQWLGEDVRWLRANIPDGRRESFFQILPFIDKVKPKILLVQDRLLMNRDEMDWHIQARRTLRYLLSQVIPLRTRQCHEAMSSWSETIREGEELLALKETFRQEYAQNMTLSEDAKQWLRQFQQHADKVVVLHFPRSLAQSSGIGRREWLNAIKEELAALDIELVEVGEPLEAEFYRDGAHVNVLGRAIYMSRIDLIIDKLL